MREMTEKQRLFAEDYVTHGVARRAALAAGYSDKRAEQQGYKLLNDPAYQAVQDYIAELRAKSAQKAEVSASEVIKELKLIAFADLADFVEWGPNGIRLKDSATLDAVRRRAIVEVKETASGGLSIKLADKVAALDRLGKHLGMFIEKHEHSGKVETSAPVINLTVTRSDG